MVKLARRFRAFAASVGGVRHPLQAELRLRLSAVALECQLFKVGDRFRDVCFAAFSPAMWPSRTFRVLLKSLVGRLTAAGGKSG
ncbi:hypothetical protein BCCGELA001_01350 [Bradyrhizobium sp. CCGE-LA001]|nr:hypothetical protein BCCGELA001_01350 [Bradyrhizobium sp. CCGE-LA001]